MEKNKLPVKSLFLMGGAIFSMHFGGASMIWPMTWGKESGTSIVPAFCGIFLTALLFPLLGYIATAKGNGTFYGLSSRISPGFGKLFCSIAMLVLGPLFCIPRMSAAAWDAFLQVSKFHPESMVAPLVFSIVYYLITYWFMAKKSDIVNKISKILFPVLIVAVVFIIFKGVLMPISNQMPKKYNVNPFAYGFKNGYATAELLCALVFATIIIDDLKYKGFSEKSFAKNLAKIGIVGIGMLTITHFGHMLVGSFTGDTFKNLQYASLYSAVVLRLWGNTGGIIFNVALLFAALTTAIGLSVATANFFQEVSENKLTYNKAAILTLSVSALVSAVGLTTIVKIVTPLLDIVYPAAITITLFYVVVPNLDKKIRIFRAYKVGVITAFIWGIYEGVLAYMDMFKIDSGVLNDIYNSFPLSSQGLGWISITALAIIIGYIFNKPKSISY